MAIRSPPMDEKVEKFDVLVVGRWGGLVSPWSTPPEYTPRVPPWSTPPEYAPGVRPRSYAPGAVAPGRLSGCGRAVRARAY